MGINISEIVSSGDCTGCGICIAACPVKCISQEKSAVSVDASSCIGCGMCLSICPGKDDEHLSDMSLDHSFIISRGKEATRYTASGGFVVSFLSYLMHKKMISGAVVVQMKGSIDSAKAVFAQDIKEIKASAGSVYFQVPLGDALSQAFSSGKKFAVVGLPCQIRGIDQLLKKKPSLKRKVFIKIGLFCGFMPGKRAAEFLIECSREKNPKRISFRAEKDGHEGFLIEAEKEFFIPKSRYVPMINWFFSEDRCFRCSEMISSYADISCGDAHGFGNKKSLVISGSTRAENMIKDACSEHFFTIDKMVGKAEVMKSQGKILAYKTGTARFRQAISGKKGLKTSSKQKATFIQCMGALLYMLNLRISKYLIFRKILCHTPLTIIKMYSYMIYHMLTWGKIK
ncbi:MAG: Coenzyme F420 hydrogenase/dehydrogenase, beta subunit C-terminal domain [Candidatus Woesearchaeota archaeon]